MDQEVVLDVNGNGEGLNERNIYKLPVWYKQQNGKDAFNPQVISLGPYHHNNFLLEPMRRHKQRALDRFLLRSNRRREELVSNLLLDVENLKACYDQLEENWQDPTEFLNLMVEDGCFIIEFLRDSAFVVNSDGQNTSGYSISDPIFGIKAMKYMSPLIGRDMLLIENQLPLPLLRNLAAMSAGPNGQIEMAGSDDRTIQITDIIHLLWRFYYPNYDLPNEQQHQQLASGLHVLDVYRQSRLLNGNYSNGTVLPAYKLWKHGLTFKKSRSLKFPDSFTDIDFQPKSNSCKWFSWCCSLSNEVLCLPSLSIDNAMESTLLNLMAFELFHSAIGYEVISYIFFMTSLLRSEKDVKLLSWYDDKLVFNEHWSELDVVQFFPKLTRGIPLKVARSIVTVNGRLRDLTKRKKWMFFEAIDLPLNHIVAICALTYAVIQTYYTMLSYYNCCGSK